MLESLPDAVLVVVSLASLYFPFLEVLSGDVQILLYPKKKKSVHFSHYAMEIPNHNTIENELMLIKIETATQLFRNFQT